VKRMKHGVCLSWLQMNWHLLDFTSQTGVMWFVVLFLEYKSAAGRREMMPLRNTRFGTHLVGLLKGCFFGNFPICSNDQPEISLSQQTNSNYDVYGCHMQHRTDSHSESCVYI